VVTSAVLLSAPAQEGGDHITDIHTARTQLLGTRHGLRTGGPLRFVF
jgi:hypothetical protein